MVSNSQVFNIIGQSYSLFLVIFIFNSLYIFQTFTSLNIRFFRSWEWLHLFLHQENWKWSLCFLNPTTLKSASQLAKSDSYWSNCFLEISSQMFHRHLKLHLLSPTLLKAASLYCLSTQNSANHPQFLPHPFIFHIQTLIRFCQF